MTVAMVALAVVVVVTVALLVRATRPAHDQAAATAGPSPDPAQTSVSTAGPSASPTTTSPSHGGPSTLSTPAMPLPDLFQRFDDTGPITSDTPTSADSLQDGAFFGILHAVDTVARTVSVDIAIFYGGDAAMAWLQVHDPERAAEGPPENDYLIVNEVERVRGLALAPTARIGTWCFDPSGVMVTRERSLEEWAAAPELSATTWCEDPGRQANDTYWVDVRGGVVAQLTGQYLP